ncbi:MAG: FABP family protein [Propionibacterium sp.]|nr:FABP family protein [Propionibacterium sp.]
MFEIPSDLSPELVALAWMRGRWVGEGHGEWPGIGTFEFGQQVEFTDNGGDYLHYLSQTWELDEKRQPKAARSMETGFWRPQRDGTVEVVMCHPEGYSEIWFGNITGARIDLTTDAVARTRTALAYTGGTRLYGQVEGDLMYAFDRQTEEHELQPYMWARLKKVAQ